MMRTRPLHNFSLPSSWGNQKFLRCIKVDSDGEFISSSSHLRSSPSADSSSPIGFKSKSNADDDEEIEEEVRAKLLIHLRTTSNKEEENSAAVRPWNLRTRRAACTAPKNSSSSSSPQKVEISNPSPNLRLRGMAAAAMSQGVEKKKKERRRDLLKTLTREEIKEDFFMMTGNNPSRRPKKRAKIVQKQIDNLYPGLYLTEITLDTYKVPDEIVETKKEVCCGNLYVDMLCGSGSCADLVEKVFECFLEKQQLSTDHKCVPATVVDAYFCRCKDVFVEWCSMIQCQLPNGLAVEAA
ncbi:hypothetical protein IFM89_039743 [Coptis chinensis]|uniref:Uncharacterized protein n=1 Tax=Coptis chinensis TaxID=261450 RepID=A0A835GVS8_9MAGN|nr:hypothetical protein IFM89_039743 [Coptis chinensis]